MNDNRSVDLLDAPQVSVKYGTTRVHAYLTYHNGAYTVSAAPYRDLGCGARGYPRAATVSRFVEAAPQLSAQRLAALAADPAVLDLARNLAAQES